MQNDAKYLMLNSRLKENKKHLKKTMNVKLTKDEQEWIKEYKKTDEYGDIYGDDSDKEEFDAKIICLKMARRRKKT